MLISPPFLPPNIGATVYDAQCIKDAMPGGLVGSGAYPVSQAMGWHGGIHIVSPAPGEPVRAIADGWVVYRRENAEITYDGQTYSTGCVVIRHETEIGARPNGPGPATPTTFIYYSITLHLSSLDKDLPAVTKPIWRKDRLGTPGKIHTQDNRIHFEIVCGDEDLAALLSRKTGRLALEHDGRSDAVYGTAYIFVPRGAPLYMTRPAAKGYGASTDLTTEDLVIGIDHEVGDTNLLTWRLAGGPVAGSLTEPNKAEYRLYEEAVSRHMAMPSNSSPSGWYELLRFGRNLGPDPLPAQVPHWRQIKLPDGSQKWIDLNTLSTTKYSDADFPHWRGWRLVDDDVADEDSRCNSRIIERLLNTTSEGESIESDTPQSRVDRLCTSDLQNKLAKTICKFPTEWVKGDVELRWKWVKELGNPYNRKPLNDEDFGKLTDFAKKLCFWEELPDIDRNRLTKKHWHFHPREFVIHLRKCLWLSESELLNGLNAAPVAGKNRAAALRLPMNVMLLKYGVNSNRSRLAHFLAQVGHETGWWQYREELGNERYFRTMYEVITSSEAAEDYRSGLAHRLNQVQSGESEQAYAMRRPGKLVIKAQSMDNGQASSTAGGSAGDGPRFRGRGFLQITGRRNYTGYGVFRGRDFITDPNPKLLASADFNACDASGYYWLREHANLEADAGFSSVNVTRVGGIVNRGSANRAPLHDVERQTLFIKIWKSFNDAT